MFAGLDKVSIEIQGLSRCVQALFLSDERGGGGGFDYLREAITLNISIKGGNYLREAINQGTAII